MKKISLRMRCVRCGKEIASILGSGTEIDCTLAPMLGESGKIKNIISREFFCPQCMEHTEHQIIGESIIDENESGAAA